MSNQIPQKINKVAAGLRELAGQLSSSSKEVATASQSLADGASRQAASLQETSASIEEISSMGKSANERVAKVAEESDKTAVLSKEGLIAIQSMGIGVNHALESGKQMEVAIAGILAANASIADITSTVDDIAFQTNILSLNAAVEAARAGEAGAGFAVVANEVRDLAGRSGKAARETAKLIENATLKSRDAAEILKDLSKRIGGILEDSSAVRARFDAIVTQSADVSSHIQELRQTANEQQLSQEQIGKATSELDQVTQKNAASAQQLSATSQEMLDNTRKLPGIAEELRELIDGKGKGSSFSQSGLTNPPMAPLNFPGQRLSGQENVVRN